MQTSHFFQKKFLLLLSLFPFFFITVSISSCGGDGTKHLTGPENCYTISRTALKTNMLAGGWSTPGNNDFVPFIYFYPSAESGSVNAIPADKDNHLFSAHKVTVNPPNMDPPCKFPALTIGPSQYDFYGQHFAENGRLIDFDFLRLKPRASTEPGYEGYMVFDVYTVTINSDGTETVVLKAYSKPCPPYCPVQ